ncbi:hypothetical protein Sme01_12420 [Sphaerisporangium melleum]|nr:hypothetical protein Sme01_12420 [Sphaerisporangium melleum]
MPSRVSWLFSLLHGPHQLVVYTLSAIVCVIPSSSAFAANIAATADVPARRQVRSGVGTPSLAPGKGVAQ